MAETGIKKANLFERIVDILAWVSFILLVPLLTDLLSFTKISDFLKESFGAYASNEYLTLYFWIIQALRIFFGGSLITSPLLIGAISSFLLFFATLPLGFMSFFNKLLEPSGLFANNILSFIMSLVILAASYFLSFRKKLHPLFSLLLLVIVPYAIVLTPSLLAKQIS